MGNVETLHESFASSDVLDLCSETFITPEVLVLTACWAQVCHRQGRARRLIEPTSVDAAAYASRMHLHEQLQPFVKNQISNQHTTETPLGDRLLNSGHSIRQLLQLVSTWQRSQ